MKPCYSLWFGAWSRLLHPLRCSYPSGSEWFIMCIRDLNQNYYRLQSGCKAPKVDNNYDCGHFSFLLMHDSQFRFSPFTVWYFSLFKILLTKSIVYWRVYSSAGWRLSYVRLFGRSYCTASLSRRQTQSANTLYEYDAMSTFSSSQYPCLRLSFYSYLLLLYFIVIYALIHEKAFSHFLNIVRNDGEAGGQHYKNLSLPKI